MYIFSMKYSGSILKIFLTHWYSSLASELSHCPEIVLRGADGYTKHSGVSLTKAKVLVQVCDAPRNILSSYLLCVCMCLCVSVCT